MDCRPFQGWVLLHPPLFTQNTVVCQQSPFRRQFQLQSERAVKSKPYSGAVLQIRAALDKHLTKHHRAEAAALANHGYVQY